MALKGNRELFAQDANAIVFHADQSHAAGQKAHGDLGCACIQRVVHQLAHHRCGTLYNLSGRNLADELIRQFADRAAWLRSGGPK